MPSLQIVQNLYIGGADFSYIAVWIKGLITIDTIELTTTRSTIKEKSLLIIKKERPNWAKFKLFKWIIR